MLACFIRFPMTTYNINEFFETIQGEGQYTGTASIFIRLQGCPVGCSWCDTKHTWPINEGVGIQLKDVLAKTDETEEWAAANAEELLSFIKNEGYRAKHVVITGGEPTLHPKSILYYNDLCKGSVNNSNKFIHMATHGNIPVDKIKSLELINS